MSIGPRLDLRQSQSLVMTPQLQQAIRLLALSTSSGKLHRRGDRAQSAARAGAGRGGAGGRSAGRGREPRRRPRRGPKPGRGVGGRQLRRRRLAARPRRQRREFPSGQRGGPGAGRLAGHGGSCPAAGTRGEGPDFDSFAAEASRLHGHLLAQAGERLSGADLVIAGPLIEQVDETGYLLASTLTWPAPRRSRSPRSSGSSPSCRPSTRPESRPEASPNASPSRRRKPTATILRWRG
jgi:RNA polymerase sigma-54 factor